jgi:serine/threonine protein phosphatase PrpC
MVSKERVFSLRCPGFLGARVQGGSIGASRSAGVGDCMLLEFSKGFFAVSDASDRDPSVSHAFMERFTRMLADNESLSASRIYGDVEKEILMDRFIGDAKQLLPLFSFGEGCTFTGILFLKTMGAMRAVILHTGDSLLFSCNLRTGDGFQFTKNNFWMVGRSQHYFQIEELPVDRDTRLLLATDGIGELLNAAGMDRELKILNLFKTERIENVPDSLFMADNSPVETWDDAAIIALDPFSMPAHSDRFIFGGTSG